MKTITRSKTKVSHNELAIDIVKALKWDTYRAVREGMFKRGHYGKFAKDSFESVIVQHMDKMSNSQKKSVYRNTLRKLRKDSSLTSFVSRHELDINSKHSIFKQLKKKVELKSPKQTSGSSSNTSSEPFFTYTDVEIKVRWKLLSVFCKDETDGAFGTEWGDDEIYMGGFGINEKAEMVEWKRRKKDQSGPQKWETVESFHVGNFDDTKSSNHHKRTKVYDPPLQLCEFTIDGERSFPINYAVSCTLVESDSDDGISQFFRDMTVRALDELRNWATGEDADEAGFLGNLLNEIRDWLVDVFFGDDAFKPLVLEYSIQNQRILDMVGGYMKAFTNNFASGKMTQEEYNRQMKSINSVLTKVETQTVKAHGGTYEIKYQWDVRYVMGLG